MPIPGGRLLVACTEAWRAKAGARYALAHQLTKLSLEHVRVWRSPFKALPGGQDQPPGAAQQRLGLIHGTHASPRINRGGGRGQIGQRRRPPRGEQRKQPVPADVVRHLAACKYTPATGRAWGVKREACTPTTAEASATPTTGGGKASPQKGARAAAAATDGCGAAA